MRLKFGGKTGQKFGVRLCIMPVPSTHLVQELNVGIVDTKKTRDYHKIQNKQIW